MSLIGRIYLTICVFVTKSHKKNLTFLCKFLFICLKLLFVFICCNCSLFVFDLFFCLLTIAISSMLCRYIVVLFLSVLNIIHVLDLESVLIPNIYTMYYSWHVLYPTLCLYTWIYGMQIKYQISNIPNRSLT
jgi:hypothetical protein